MKNLGIVNRFPSLRDNIKVYAVIVAFLYAWSTLWLFWELPSSLYYLTAAEIVSIFAYSLATNLFESLLVLAGLDLFCFLLPKSWFHDSFVARSLLLVSLGLGYLMVFASLFGKEGAYPRDLLLWSPVVLVVIFLFSLFLGRVALVKKLAEAITDRLTIFLYVTVPLSVFALLLVIVRNVW